VPVGEPHALQSRATMGGSTNCMWDLCQAMLWRTRLHLVRRSRGSALVMDVPFPTGGSSATGQHAEYCAVLLKAWAHASPFSQEILVRRHVAAQDLVA